METEGDVGGEQFDTAATEVAALPPSKPNIGIALLEVARHSGRGVDLPIPKRDDAAGTATFD